VTTKSTLYDKIWRWEIEFSWSVNLEFKLP
jgi:hypothetical protein